MARSDSWGEYTRNRAKTESERIDQFLAGARTRSDNAQRQVRGAITDTIIFGGLIYLNRRMKRRR